MIPMITFADNESVNLAQICRTQYHQKNETISVYFANNDVINYDGDKMRALLFILNLNVKQYDGYLQSLLAAESRIKPASMIL